MVVYRCFLPLSGCVRRSVVLCGLAKGWFVVCGHGHYYIIILVFLGALGLSFGSFLVFFVSFRGSSFSGTVSLVSRDVLRDGHRDTSLSDSKWFFLVRSGLSLRYFARADFLKRGSTIIVSSTQ